MDYAHCFYIKLFKFKKLAQKSPEIFKNKVILSVPYDSLLNIT